jgi:hypothetical protein
MMEYVLVAAIVTILLLLVWNALVSDVNDLENTDDER